MDYGISYRCSWNVYAVMYEASVDEDGRTRKGGMATVARSIGVV